MTTQVSEAVWQGEAERIDRVLAELRLVRSRSQASEFISAGLVLLNGSPVTKTGTRVRAGAVIEVRGGDHYVSRAAHKLIAGLDAFGVSPKAKRCLDVGASTGGFTQVLLERGAQQVFALDVGHDQLASTVRTDNRVVVLEGCNAREMTAGTLGLAYGSADLPSLVVADISFISLRLVLAAMVRVAARSADFVLLVKPQFEVGRLGVKNGIVSDPVVAAAAVCEVMVAAGELGLDTLGIVASPIAGGFGNHEFVVHFAHRDEVDPGRWNQRVYQLCTDTIGVVNTPRVPNVEGAN